jgi:hypothetical protein
MTVVELNYFSKNIPPFPRWRVFWKGRWFDEFGSTSESWDRVIVFLKERNVTAEEVRIKEEGGRAARADFKEWFLQDLR